MRRSVITLVAMALFIGLLSNQALAQEPAQCQEEYSVQRGDWLSKIAEKYFGDLLAYSLIVKANNLQSDDPYTDIANPDLIEPGWKLCIPPASADAASAPASVPDLTGPVWLWQQTAMNNGDMFTPDNPGNYTVQFNPDGTVSVKADCNQVRGTYTVDGNKITIELGPSTMVACPEGSLADQFLAGLSAAVIYFFDGPDLVIDLMFDSGTMRFNPQSNDLAGTNWNVIGYNNGRGGVVSVIIGTEITASFGADGNLTGSSGCNNYQAGYETDGNNISIGLGISTQMFCAEPEGIMEQEQEYLAALPTASTYQINGDRMEMRTAEGSIVATFEAAKSNELAGTDWTVIDYNNGRGGVVSTIIGTELTASFGADGNLSGSAGCNTYQAGYETDGNNISIGPAITTMMACGEPEGIMEQEQEYLAALSTAATYQITGNRLEMRTADGAIVASFEAR